MPNKERGKTHNRPALEPFRRKLRKRLTPAEATLWKILKSSQLDGRKFRRQHSVGPYILDFYCPEESLCIELDGQVHYNEIAAEHDAKRKQFLNTVGIKVLRFENRFVFEETEYVLQRISSEFGWWKKQIK
jgi:very-short-patch-repair endonuclease